jgi:23S rRNA (adenine2503-C2)-methyltransferase
MQVSDIWNSVSKLTDTQNDLVSKFIFKKADALVEAVLYKYPTFQERTVICCSTQCGCPIGCTFCGSGNFFARSLKASEIVTQVMACLNATGVDPSTIQNLQIMFMSMGEPMLNYDNLELALIELHSLYPNAKLLVSTSAPPKPCSGFGRLIRLAKQITQIGLQFSVHESTDEARAKLIRTRTRPLESISRLGAWWVLETGRPAFFNYCVHEGNNSPEDVERLKTLFNPSIWEATLSVICQKDETVSSSIDRQEKLAKDFAGLMAEAGFSTRVFNPAGQDSIGGGCGQLWRVQEWARENNKLRKA